MQSTSKPPTVKALAAACGVSPRRIGQLKTEGMPCHSIEAALAWRSAQTDNNSVEKLRAERILLVQEQRAKIALENAVRRGELVDVHEVHAAGLTIAAGTRAALLQLANDLPPRLEGLSAAKIGRVLRESHVRILNELSSGKWMDSPEVLAIIESARLESKGK